MGKCHSSCCAKPAPTDVQVIAGRGPKEDGNTNGNKTAARFHTPKGLCRYRDVNGTCLLVADNDSHQIRRVNVVDGKADSTTESFLGGAHKGLKNGAPLSAQLDNPHDVAFDEKNDVVYFTCRYAVRKLEKNRVTTVCGGSKSALRDGKGASARFQRPRGLVVSADGRTLYVCDCDSLRRVDTQTGCVTTLIGASKRKTSRTADADDTKGVRWDYSDGDDDDDDDDDAGDWADEYDGDSKDTKRKPKRKSRRARLAIKEPRSIAFDPHTATLETALYITGAGTIYRYDMEQDSLREFSVQRSGLDPYGFAVMPNGQFLVTSNSLAQKRHFRTGLFVVDPDSVKCTPVATNANEKRSGEDCIVVSDVAWTGDGSNSYFAAPFGLLRHWDDSAEAVFVTDANNNAIVQISLRFHEELFDALTVKPGTQALPPADKRAVYDPFDEKTTATTTTTTGGSSGESTRTSSGRGSRNKEDDDSDGEKDAKSRSGGGGGGEGGGGSGSRSGNESGSKRNLRHRLAPSTITRLSASLPALPPIAAFPSGTCRGRCEPGACKPCDLQYDRDREIELMIRAWYAFTPKQGAPVVDERRGDPSDAKRCCGYDAVTDGQCRRAANAKCVAVSIRGGLCRNCCAEMHALLPAALDYCSVHGVQKGGQFVTGEELQYTPPWPKLTTTSTTASTTPQPFVVTTTTPTATPTVTVTTTTTVPAVPAPIPVSAYTTSLGVISTKPAVVSPALSDLSALDLARVRMKINLGLNEQFLVVNNRLQAARQSMDAVVDEHGSGCNNYRC